MNGVERPIEGRIIAGVCAALAIRFGLNVMVVRVIAVIAALVAGLSVWAYLILWYIIPSEKAAPDHSASGTPSPSE